MLVHNKIEEADWGMADLEDIIGDCRRNLGCDYENPRKPQSLRRHGKKSSKSKTRGRRKSMPSLSSNEKDEAVESKSRRKSKRPSMPSLSSNEKDEAVESKSHRKSKRPSRSKGKRKHKADKSPDGPIVGENYFGSLVIDVKEKTIKTDEGRIHLSKTITFDSGMVMKEDSYKDMKPTSL